MFDVLGRAPPLAPKRRLAVLFTQTMSEDSLGVLNTLFANDVVAVNV